jgi:molecular chaperone DnaK
MIKDAEAHAEEDRKLTELVSVRNRADSMIHATEKSLKELGDQVGADEKSSIEKSIEALKQAVKGDNKNEIESKTNELTELSGKLAERVYAQKSAPGGADQSAKSSTDHNADEGVVDAEFEEVKEDNKG